MEEQSSGSDGRAIEEERLARRLDREGRRCQAQDRSKAPASPRRSAADEEDGSGQDLYSAKKTASTASAVKKKSPPKKRLKPVNTARQTSPPRQKKPEWGTLGHKEPMPSVIHPMLATLVDEPFDNDDWLFEIKWDGYRAIAFIEGDRLRLVSRNQNDLTKAYPELQEIPQHVRARTAILDGEIVALDEQGRPSFGLMQQRTGVGEGGRRIRRTRDDIPVVYYVFDLLYLDGYNLMRVELEKRKELLASILAPSDCLRFSDHYVGRGIDLFQAAAERGLEGIVAKQRRSCYEPKRSQRMAEDQDHPPPGVRDRRLHRPARLARELRVAGARTLRR